MLRCAFATMLLAGLIPAHGLAAPVAHLHGVVLRSTPYDGTVIVRHDAYGGMPAMTMPFRVVPRSRAAELPVGAIIDADVDERTEPWTLSHVQTTTVQAVTAQPAQRSVTPLHIGDTVPATMFVDQRGQPFSFRQLHGQDVVLAFIYTRCQDARMCPLISAKFHALQSGIGKRRLHLVEVTLDPSYDRPPVLARYAATFGADPSRWTLAVGDAGATLDFAARFGIATFPDPSVGIVHSENTVLIGPDGTIDEMLADQSWTPAEIVDQIDAAHGRASNPLARVSRWLAAAGSAGNSAGQFGVLREFIVLAIVAAALAYLVRRLYQAIFAEHA